MGSVVCTNKKSPPSTLADVSNPYLTDENHVEVKDNNDKYFDEGELKELENNELNV